LGCWCKACGWGVTRNVRKASFCSKVVAVIIVLLGTVLATNLIQNKLH
jgi:hypothetical protein